MPETGLFPQNTSNQFEEHPITPNLSFHNRFKFIVHVLLAFTELKYHGNASDSPFEEHPVTIWFATGCLLVYCTVYAVDLAKFSGNAQAYTIYVHHFNFLVGSLSIASLASMIFPSSFQPLLYGICIIVSVDRRQLLFNTTAMFINSAYVSIRSRLLTERDGGRDTPV